MRNYLAAWVMPVGGWQMADWKRASDAGKGFQAGMQQHVEKYNLFRSVIITPSSSIQQLSAPSVFAWTAPWRPLQPSSIFCDLMHASLT